MANKKLIDITINKAELTTLVTVDFMEQKAREVIVSDLYSFELAANMVGDITARIAEREDMRKRVKAPILEAGRKIDAMFKVPINQGEKVKAIIKNKMTIYQQTVAAERREAEDKANKKAQEVKRKTEADALALMEKGEEDAAQELLDNMDMAPNPTSVIPSLKVKGVSSRANWKAEVTDLLKLVKAVSKGQAPINLLTINISAANRYAKVVRDTLEVEGIRFYNDETLVVKKTSPKDAI